MTLKNQPLQVNMEDCRTLPKVLLHDHLDGGLRPETIIELATASNVRVACTNPENLRTWFQQGAKNGDLRLYLQGFEPIYQILQTTEALHRVAYEMMEDMKNDGIVYVETRFAPVYHTRNGLTHQQVVDAVLEGLTDGSRDFGVGFGLIISSMRDMDISLEMAELAVDNRPRGVVGFDLAGDEKGHPPKKHLEAFHYIQRQNFNITIHAGEAFGKESIWQALQFCGSHRIGHGTRLQEDMVFREEEVIKLGDLAQYILDKRIPLECCLSSNVHTGAIYSLHEHPFRHFYKKQFRVTLNTDNRLMSATSLSREYLIAAQQFNLTLKDLERLTLNAMKSAFIHYEERLHYIYDIIKPKFQAVDQNADSP